MPTPDDLATLLTGNPKLLTVVGFLAFFVYVLKLVAEASETAAKYLGKPGRYWRRRGQLAVEAAAEARKSIGQRLSDVEADRDNAYTRLKSVERREQTQQRELDTIRDYLVYDSGWHYRYEQRAASRGEALDDSDIHKSYPQFEAEHAANQPHPEW